MKIGVVSDTHNNLKNVRRIVELFNGACVDHVVHTGDITKGTTLDLFADLRCSLSGVFGNNDLERDELLHSIKQHGFRFQNPPLELDLEGVSVLVVHDPREIDRQTPSNYDLVLHGHTHLLRIDRDNARLTFNPGECAGHMAGLNAVGVVSLPSLEVELLKF